MTSTQPSSVPRLRPLLVLVVGALLGALVFGLFGPRQPTLGPAVGDPALAADALAALGSPTGYRQLSIVRIRDGEATWAGFGEVTPDSRFELGSITKTFDGLLLADAVERGEVGLDDRLDAHLPELAGAPAGEVTLAELASHRSGLPAMGAIDWGRVVVEDLAGKALTDYTAGSTDDVIAATRSITPTTRGTMVYSNLGAALLGHALARAGGAPDWPTHVTDRLLAPLGMRDTRIAEAGRPAPDLLQPHAPNGTPTEPWTGQGYAPAGLGITTTATDLTRYAQAILDGTAPGLSALEPHWPASLMPGLDQQIGLAWMTATSGEHVAAWHNGGTGGMRTVLAVDRDRGTAVVLLSDVARDVTRAGLALAGVPDAFPPPIPVDPDTVPWVVVGWFTVILFAIGAARGRSRLRILGQGLGALGALAMWWVAAPWLDFTPAWTFGLAAGLAGASAVIAGRRWSSLPWLPQRWRPVAVALVVVGGVWFALMVALIAQVWALRG